MKKQTLPKMHFACSNDELRESMQHVEITKEHVVASNGNILIAHNTKDLFPSDFIDAMPDKFYIHKNVWRELSKPYLYIIFENDLIVQQMDGYRMYYAPVIPNWNYPDWKSILPNLEESEPVNEIGLSTNLVSIFNKAFFMPYESNRTKLTFFGKNKGIYVEHLESDSFGIIMPQMI